MFSAATFYPLQLRNEMYVPLLKSYHIYKRLHNVTPRKQFRYSDPLFQKPWRKSLSLCTYRFKIVLTIGRSVGHIICL